MQFESEADAYENASEVLAFCRSFLEETGHCDVALYLAVDRVYDHLSARAALSQLIGARAQATTAEARHVVTLAVNAVERVLATPELLAAS
jgi:hypothetical protein